MESPKWICTEFQRKSTTKRTANSLQRWIVLFVNLRWNFDQKFCGWSPQFPNINADPFFPFRLPISIIPKCLYFVYITLHLITAIFIGIQFPNNSPTFPPKFIHISLWPIKQIKMHLICLFVFFSLPFHIYGQISISELTANANKEAESAEGIPHCTSPNPILCWRNCQQNICPRTIRFAACHSAWIWSKNATRPEPITSNHRPFPCIFDVSLLLGTMNLVRGKWAYFW